MKKTKEVRIGNVTIGGGRIPLIQSMCNAPANDIDAVAAQINALSRAGCGVVRIAVPDKESAISIKNIIPKIKVPLVADIHFDYKLALLAVENGAHKIRINPGNIIGADGGEKIMDSIADCLKGHKAALRIGANSGSLAHPAALVRSCLDCLREFEKRGFDNIVLSVKSSSVAETVKAYRELSKATDYPLHLGVTEAGLYESALVKSSVALGALLLDGIGDTIRVSVTGDPLEEVRAAKMILRAAGLDRNYCEIISCPTCARCTVDLVALTKRIEEYVNNVQCTMYNVQLKVAVMGCAVNGPGEARDADLGIACGDGKGVIFVKGEIVGAYPEGELFGEFCRRFDRLFLKG